MQVNKINNMAFSSLHIKRNNTNKVVLEKCLKLNPEATKEALDDINRESGDEDVYMYSGMCDGSNVDLVFTDKKMNIIAARRIGIGNPDHFRIAINRLVFQFTDAICRPKALEPTGNEEVSEILNQYV